MKIINRENIYCPTGVNKWDLNAFMTPSPLLINEEVIRIWGGCRDENGVSRIGYIDVEADNPKKLIRTTEKPVLDVGNPGCFDDNGVILGDVIRVGSQIYMYYVGFQHVEKVKFCAFSGLAISNDEGRTFERYSEVPIMDRSNRGRYGRCIHTVLYDEGIFKVYYAIINDWKFIDHIPYPVYDIWYTESNDGKQIALKDDVLCVKTNVDEYRIGRPKVYKTNNGYEMYYTRDFISKDYVIGYAISEDGKKWQRKDEKFIISKAESGWDSEMTCYPVVLNFKDKKYIFYNGNGMGKTGIGYIEVK